MNAFKGFGTFHLVEIFILPTKKTVINNSIITSPDFFRKMRLCSF